MIMDVLVGVERDTGRSDLLCEYVERERREYLNCFQGSFEDSWRPSKLLSRTAVILLRR